MMVPTFKPTRQRDSCYPAESTPGKHRPEAHATCAFPQVFNHFATLPEAISTLSGPNMMVAFSRWFRAVGFIE